MTSEESQSQPVIVSGSIHSVASASPPTDRTSPVHPHSPELRSVDENNYDVAVEARIQHRDDSPMLDVSCIKVCVWKKNLK